MPQQNKPLILQRTTFLLFGLVMATTSVFAQYPSTTTLIADVKAQNPTEFQTVTPTGNWAMTHDKVPDWQKPDACEHQVSIVGKKKPDGTWWTYGGIAIYNSAGGKMVFNRLFIIEDETSLNGVTIPDNSELISIFKQKLEERDPFLLKMNPSIAGATNFYGFELKGKPKVTGNKEEILLIYTVDITHDSYHGSGTKLSKRTSPVRVKLKKEGSDFVFSSLSKAGDYKLVEEQDFGSKAILESIPTYKNSSKSLAEFTNDNPSYPQVSGSNGEGYINDQELIPLIESTFLTKAENFAILFGEKGATMITEVKFKTIDGISAVTNGDSQMSKIVLLEYVFFNEKAAEQKFFVHTGQRQIEIQLKKDNLGWLISGAKFITEVEYVKQETIAWSYRNGTKDKAFAKRVFGM